MGYAWSWEDDEEFMLPDAFHITVWAEDDQGSYTDEVCNIILRKQYATDEARQRAESRAAWICDALDASDAHNTPSDVYGIGADPI